MNALYHIFIFCYAFAIKIASLFNKKAKFWVDGRKNIFKEIQEKINANDDVIWFHCASLGEYEQARPVIEQLKIKLPTYKILITFFSPSGYEYRKNDSLVDYVFYLPIDTKIKTKNFVSIINPKFVFFVKYEFWYNYILELKSREIPTFLISGVFRNDQLFFKWYGAWYKKVLTGFTHFYVQNEASKSILNLHHFNNVTTCGDTRFDRTYGNSLNPIELPLIQAFKNDKILLVGGSTWATEEQILSKFNLGDFKLIIAPHNINESHILEIEQLFKKDCLRYSNANHENVLTTSVLLIDNIGLLSNIYQYADIAFVGGGFTGALHNIIEPASFGNVVLFGPNHTKFHEANEMLTNKGAFEIQDFKDFVEKINYIKQSLPDYQENSKKFVLERIGSTEKIIKSLSNYIEYPSS